MMSQQLLRASQSCKKRRIPQNKAKPTIQNLLIQTYQTKFMKTNQTIYPIKTYQTEPSEPNLPKQNYQMKSTQPTLPNQFF